MTKLELVEKISDKLGCTKVEADKTLNGVVDIIKEAILQGEKVQLVGFGIFEPKTIAARKARNPRTGEEFMTTESKGMRFSVSGKFKEELNK